LERRVSPATQRPALNALAFLGKSVHGIEDLNFGFTPAQDGSRRPPTVLTREEVRSVLNEMENPWKLMCEVIYGAGLRQMEALRLRVKDLDSTMIYLHVIKRPGAGAPSPLDLP